MKKNSRYCYICGSYYHLLITLINVMKNNVETDLILSSDILINNKELLEKLKASELFNEILFIDYNKLKNRYLNLIRLFFYENHLLNTKKYEEIYLFNDIGLIKWLLDRKKIYYNLIEDGTDYFKNYNKPYDIMLSRNDKNLARKIISKLLKINRVGESKYIKSVEVNDKNDIWIENDNIIEKPKTKLFESLTNAEKEQITNIFLDDNIKINNNSVLVLTQPISEDALCDSEKTKIEIYRKIIEEYCSNESNIIFKLHPRDKTDYKKYFNNITILSSKFPIEILSFSTDIKFKKAITISSTSIHTIKNCNEKIVLGMDYINKVMGETNDSK